MNILAGTGTDSLRNRPYTHFSENHFSEFFARHFLELTTWVHIELARQTSPNMETEAELNDVVDLTMAPEVTIHEAQLPNMVVGRFLACGAW